MDALKGLFPSIYSCRDALHPSSSSDVEELVESMRETQRSIGMVPKGVFQADHPKGIAPGPLNFLRSLVRCCQLFWPKKRPTWEVSPS